MIHHHLSEDNFEDNGFGRATALLRELTLLTESINAFEPLSSGADQDWEFYFKIGRKWHVFDVKLYQDTWYCNLSPGVSSSFYEKGNSSFAFSLNFEKSDDLNIADTVKREIPAITSAIRNIYKEVKDNPLGYHAQLQKSVPPTLKWGVTPSYLLVDMLPNLRSFLSELSRSEIEKISAICEAPASECLANMTAHKFFKYCKVAYLANSKLFEEYKMPIDPSASGRDLYINFADGRSAGLTEIDLHSPDAFAKWHANHKNLGAHPWEIYRGGNSTHIDLRVDSVNQGSKKGWQITLSAFSSGRLAETSRIAIALNEAKLPFELENKKSYLQRLRCEDMIGIVPDGFDTKYGWHNFPQQFNVADSIHWSWLKEGGPELKPLLKDLEKATSWLPIRPLRLRTV